MSRNVWHKRFHGDALNGYMGLSLEMRGAYTTLLDLMYDTDWEIGVLDRERLIAGHLDVSIRKWNSIRKELIDAGKIDVIDGFISNFRYRKERENALEISRARAKSGSSGGEKSGETRRKSKEINDGSEANASDLFLYTRAQEAETEADTEREEEDKSSSPARERTHERASRIREAFALPEDIPSEEWGGFEEMRKRKRAPMTDRARGGVVKKLRELRTQGHDPGDVLDQSTRNSWTDVYPIKEQQNGNHRNGSSKGSGSGDGFIDAIREHRDRTPPR